MQSYNEVVTPTKICTTGQCVCPWSKASGSWWVKLKRWSWNVFFFSCLMNRCCRHWAPRCKKKKKIKSPHRRTFQLLVWWSVAFLFNVTSEEESRLFCSGSESPLLKSIRATQRPLQIFRVQCFRTPGCHSDIGVTEDEEPRSFIQCLWEVVALRGNIPVELFYCVDFFAI